MPLPTVLLTAAALTWLNPHVYLDTVVLLGSVAAAQGELRWAFGTGAGVASMVWFSALGAGARLLRPVFARPSAWRVLDALIAVVMVVLAVGLGTAARASVTGIEETAVRALVKLEQVLPAHLRRRVSALGSATIAPPVTGPTVDPHHLTVIAAACRDLDGVDEVAVTGEHVQLLVHAGRRLLPVVLEAAERAGAALKSVEVVEPDLEAVFLHLTGTALRE